LEEFVQKLYVERKGAVALLDHMPEDYIQHSPSIVSGRDASIQALSILAPENVSMTIRHYGMDGDLAWIFTRYDFVNQAEPLAIADFLRFNGSCIQEHWDVVQERPANRTNPLDMW
jgi:predicted SnoaL-like aldol condensation-catalyzing enzyme